MSNLIPFVNDCNKRILTSLDILDKETKEAKIYLQNVRGLSDNALENHHIGYLPLIDNIPMEVKFFGAKGWDCSQYIRGKVILPIYSEFQDLVAFATRTPSSEKGNSWWNLPYPFEKSQYLFLLDKVRKEVFSFNKIYLVEGYLDAITLFENGLKTVVALMGAKISIRQVALIARYCSNVCICMDVDLNQSGQKAQNEIIYTLNEFGFCDSLSIIDGLPQGKDPDQFVIEKGLNSFLDLERQLSVKEINEISQVVREQHGKN